VAKARRISRKTPTGIAGLNPEPTGGAAGAKEPLIGDTLGGGPFVVAPNPRAAEEIDVDLGDLLLEIPARGVPTLVTSPSAKTSGKRVCSVPRSTGIQPFSANPDSSTTFGATCTGTASRRS
jgi:hypothetical protein